MFELPVGEQAESLARLLNIARDVVGLALGIVLLASLSSCGIYGDWFTNVADNHSEYAVIVAASKGDNAGKSYRIAPHNGLTIPYGNLSYYVTIRTDSPNPRTLFDGHLCGGDWTLAPAILVIDPNLTVSCVRMRDLRVSR